MTRLRGGRISNVPTLKDSAGNRYVEFDMSDNEQIRVTYVAHQDWADGPTIRVQKRAYTGRVSPGPEFPQATRMNSSRR